MKGIFFNSTLVVLLALSSCSFQVNNDKPEVTLLAVTDVPVNRITALGTTDKIVAAIEIEGMMCTKACGGKITKELLKLDGAKDVTINFDETRPTNFASIEFDPGELTTDEMIACIHRIADGKLYAVKSVTVTEYSS